MIKSLSYISNGTQWSQKKTKIWEFVYLSQLEIVNNFQTARTLVVSHTIGNLN